MNQQLQDFIEKYQGQAVDPTPEMLDSLTGDLEEVFCFKNEYGSEDIHMMIFSDYVSLSFSHWSHEYPLNEEGVEQCLHDCENLFEDKAYLFVASLHGHQLISFIHDEPGKFYELAKKGFTANINGVPFEFDPNTIDNQFIFWDPAMMNPVDSPYVI